MTFLNKSNFISEESISFDEQNRIVFYQCAFDPQQFSQALYAELGVQLPTAIASALTKRQAEFLAGRYVAHQALKHLGLRFDQIPIGAARAPIWPAGVVASISHLNSRAICAASLDSHTQFLGIDIEQQLDLTTALEIKQSIISASEEAILNATGMQLDVALTIAFSAKECLFKALYPYVGDYFGFEEAQIREISVTESMLTLQIMNNLSPKIQAGMRFHCYFKMDGATMFTLLAGGFGEEQAFCLPALVQWKTRLH